MKKLLLTIIGVAALLATTLTSQAGIVRASSGTDFAGGNATTNVLNAATNTPLSVFAFPNSSQNSLQIGFQCTAANTTPIILRLDTSINGGQWVTNALSWSVTPAGNSYLVFSTNLTGVVPMWRIRTIENSGGGDITNLIVQAFTKPGI